MFGQWIRLDLGHQATSESNQNSTGPGLTSGPLFKGSSKRIAWSAFVEDLQTLINDSPRVPTTFGSVELIMSSWDELVLFSIHDVCSFWKILRRFLLLEPYGKSVVGAAT